MTVPYRLRAPRQSRSTTGEPLGPLVRTHRLAAQRKVIWAAIPFALLLAYVVLLGRDGQLLRWFNSMFSAGAVSFLFALSIVLIVYTAAVGGAEAIRVHTNGIVDLRGRAVTMRWDDMHSLVPVFSSQGMLVRHVLRAEDGSLLSLSPAIGEVETLIDEIRVRMTERKAADLEARVAQGGLVRFGAVEARGEGLLAGGKMLPWSSVGDIGVEGAELVVHDRGGRPWGRAPLGEVPNAFLLADLAEMLSLKARA
jgi:hypothetical protein